MLSSIWLQNLKSGKRSSNFQNRLSRGFDDFVISQNKKSFNYPSNFRFYFVEKTISNLVDQISVWWHFECLPNRLRGHRWHFQNSISERFWQEPADCFCLGMLRIQICWALEKSVFFCVFALFLGRIWSQTERFPIEFVGHFNPTLRY